MIYNELFSALGYRPHLGQVKFHENDHRFKLLLAGARFGKSLAASRDVLSDLISGETRGWLVGPTYALTTPEFRNLQLDIQQNMTADMKFHTSQGTGGFVKSEWGSEVWCLSAHLPQGLLGEEIDWLILCEAAHIKADVFARFLRARLATRLGRLIIPSTPHGHNWLHELYRKTSQLDSWLVQQHATWENPLIDNSEIEQAREMLSPEAFAEQFGGEFTTRSGRVYPEFSPETHLIDDYELAHGQIIYRGIDFGFSNPFACVWLTHNGNQWQIIAEYVQSTRVLDEHISAVNRIDDQLRARGAVIGTSWADPSGALEREELKIGGIDSSVADNRTTGGIEIVRQQLKVRDGKPRMVVHQSCRHLIGEFCNYVWKEAQSDRDVPEKKNDHALDALRYALVGATRCVDWSEAVVVW